jgi:hypothetical protein
MLDRSPRTRALGIGRVTSPGSGMAGATTGMKDHLQIRLQNPPWRHVCAVGDVEHSLVIAHRALWYQPPSLARLSPEERIGS